MTRKEYFDRIGLKYAPIGFGVAIVAVIIASLFANQLSQNFTSTPSCNETNFTEPCVREEQATIQRFDPNFYDPLQNPIGRRAALTQIVLETRDGVETITTEQSIYDLYPGEVTTLYRINGRVAAIDTPHGRELIYLNNPWFNWAFLFFGLVVIGAFVISIPYLARRNKQAREARAAKR